MALHQGICELTDAQDAPMPTESCTQQAQLEFRRLAWHSADKHHEKAGVSMNTQYLLHAGLDW